MDSHKERASRIDRLLKICHDRGWTDYTPDIASRLEQLLAPERFTRRTRHDYVTNVIEALVIERQNQKLERSVQRAIESASLDLAVDLAYRESLKPKHNKTNPGKPGKTKPSRQNVHTQGNLIPSVGILTPSVKKRARTVTSSSLFLPTFRAKSNAPRL